MILSNQIQCRKCNDIIYSATRHDFRACSCGAVSVDGGNDYLRRVGDLKAIKEMSIEIPFEKADALMKAIKWARETKRNDYGILCAVARAWRDGEFDDRV